MLPSQVANRRVSRPTTYKLRTNTDVYFLRLEPSALISNALRAFSKEMCNLFDSGFPTDFTLAGIRVTFDYYATPITSYEASILH